MGMRVVAVPDARFYAKRDHGHLFQHADLVVDSLADLSMAAWTNDRML